jgi:chemosensory pili system protein ChpA (sensor histidine kinase/response regulator)
MQLLEIPEQTPSSEIDEEIIEIFVEEVNEVFEEIVSNLKIWKTDPEDSESVKNLRRSFHTLKGSGRLVGATVIGELGWRFENMLNQVIKGILSVNSNMWVLLDQVEKVLPGLVEQFQQGQSASQEVILLISQADYLVESNGQSLGDFEMTTMASSEEVSPISISEAPVLEEKPLSEEETNFEEENHLELVQTQTSDTIKTSVPEVGRESLSLEPSDGLDSTAETAEIDMTNVSEVESEGEDLSEDHQELELGLEELPDLELSHEDLSEGEIELGFDELPDLELEVDDLPDGLVELENLHFPESELEPSIENDLNQPKTVAPFIIEDEDTEPIDPVLFEIFKTEATEHLDNLKESLALIATQSPAYVEHEMVRAFHTLNGSSRSVDFLAISVIAAPMEEYARTLFEQQTELTPDMLAYFQQAVQMLEDLLDNKPVDEKQQQTLLENVGSLPKPFSSSPSPTAESPEREPMITTTSSVSATSESEAAVPDATDEFMAIFLDEAEEILENTQSLLERWTVAPNNMQLMKELQRELHTLKGGSRMVGITQMGDLSHHLESVLTKIVEGTAQSSSKLQEIVQNSVDELAAMLEAVRASVPLDTPNDLIQQINAALGKDEGEVETTPTPATPATKADKPTTPASPKEAPSSDTETNQADKQLTEKEAELADGAEDRIRVRAVVIDKLTNLAGELSISRAHMEQQQGSIKGNLGEMEQTVIRLRDQLRRLEIETEAQIISHFSGIKGPSNDNEEFDPLELDRFSVMQQLSRSLMESINDLTNIQDSLKTLTRQSDTLLIQQTRIGAELQENIMRTRMVPFARISPRLQRIARLTARELHKQIDFIINGENIEFERTVLNRVVAPLEHMLRNAIGHGIEDAQTRQQAGKANLAKITVDLSKEGAELIIKLSDDGAGLNLPAIRKKAEERGLIKRDTVISDNELMQFILEPAFSTAKKVTQISGRGVGMDVASSEIKQLGGSLRIHSKTGKGTTFDIRLPLSLTINQALLVHVGEETMAIPISHLDAVMRLPRASVISETQEERYYQYMDKSYRVYQLGELLGFGKIASPDMPLIPTLLVRAAERRVALLVDGIEGSKEIVVKSVGPQMGAIRWIAGATILGDGRVVLILDVPTLTRGEAITATQQKVSPQVTEVVEETPVAKTIMVVDDSITVRKVTARLLKRQGMEVLTAKDGLDAVGQLQEHIPDLMLLDVEMPRMDGYELATQVRNNPDLKHIPIIMITSRTGAKHRDKAEKIGINRYLGKPFNETELLENINALLAETNG